MLKTKFNRDFFWHNKILVKQNSAKKTFSNKNNLKKKNSVCAGGGAVGGAVVVVGTHGAAFGKEGRRVDQ